MGGVAVGGKFAKPVVRHCSRGASGRSPRRSTRQPAAEWVHSVLSRRLAHTPGSAPGCASSAPHGRCSSTSRGLASQRWPTDGGSFYLCRGWRDDHVGEVRRVLQTFLHLSALGPEAGRERVCLTRACSESLRKSSDRPENRPTFPWCSLSRVRRTDTLGASTTKVLHFAESPLSDSNRRPPPYHFGVTATGRNPRQRFRPIRVVFAAGPFAAGCQRLRPLCSINAPSPVVCLGYERRLRLDPSATFRIRSRRRSHTSTNTGRTGRSGSGRRSATSNHSPTWSSQSPTPPRPARRADPRIRTRRITALAENQDPAETARRPTQLRRQTVRRYP
jgi:hypothetical protein